MNQEQILVLVADLMFTVRIGDAAKRAGATVKFVQSPDDLSERAKAGARLIILDLNNRQADTLNVISLLKKESHTKNIPLVGFVSHVEGDLIRAARQAGCDTVMARSAFVAALPEILRPTSTSGGAS